MRAPSFLPYLIGVAILPSAALLPPPANAQAPSGVQVSLASPPEGYLSDPLQLLSDRAAGDLRRALSLHASHSPIDVYLLVLARGQEVPDRVPQAVQGWSGEQDQILTVFHYQSPETATLYWRSGTKQASQSEAAGILQACAREAAMGQVAEEQIERFLAELSVQLHRVTEARLSKAGQQADQADEKSPSASGLNLRQIPLPVLALGIVILAIFGWSIAGLILRGPVYLPQVEVCHRLGAPYGGGGQPVIRFDRPQAGGR